MPTSSQTVFSRSRRSPLVLACLLAICSPPLWAGTQIVVQTGVGSPDGNGEFDLFNAPTINAAGQIAFLAQLTGTAGGSADNTGMFRRDSNGDLARVVRNGGTFEGKNILGFFPGFGYISASGTVSSLAIFSGGGSAYTLGTGGPLTQMYPPLMPSPSGQSNALLGVTAHVVNDSGVSVYRAVFNGAQPESGLYERSANGVHTVRLLNQTSAPRGGTITSPGGFPTLNETDQIGTILTIDVGGPSTIRSAARIDGTTVNELVRQGDLLPDGVTTVGSFLSASGFVNSAGQVAFAANLTRPSYGGQGIFLADTSTASCIATGVLPGSTTAANNMQVVGISDAGQVAFTTEFGGGFDPLSGVYLSGTSGTTLAAFEDTATPLPGKFFRGFLSGGTTINDAGQLAFMADLSDTVNGASTGRGIFFYDAASGLQQVARTGDSLNGSTITTVYYFGTVIGTGSVSPDTSFTGLNSLGQVAFAYTLADGTDGVAIWTKPAGVPGDYNNNGTVDAGDYVLWRKHNNTATTLPNDSTPGTDSSDYNVWRSHFGQPVGSGSLSSTAAPEPSCLLLLILGSTFSIGSGRPRANRVPTTH
jgi:hypothetical protein